MMLLTHKLLNRFQELIHQQISFRFSPARLFSLERNLRERVKSMSLDAIEDYFQLVKSNSQELQTLIEDVTTKKTGFFRIPGQFKALREKVLPQLEDRLSQDIQHWIAENGWPVAWRGPLRVWSAGCSTGEEPYSIAMSLREGLRYPRAWNPKILATDISREALEKASLGFYQSCSLSEIPREYQQKYLTPAEGGAFMSPLLQEKISFRIGNLRNLILGKNNSWALLSLDGNREFINLTSSFDIIFCRNVMIYFDFPDQQRLLDGLYTCLRPGGYLFTGDAELLCLHRHKFTTLKHHGTFYYQKPEE